MLGTKGLQALRDLKAAWEEEKDDGSYVDDFDYFTMNDLVKMTQRALYHLTRGEEGTPNHLELQVGAMPSDKTFESLHRDARMYVKTFCSYSSMVEEEEAAYYMAMNRAKELGLPLPPPGEYTDVNKRESELLGAVFPEIGECGMAEPVKPGFVQSTSPLMNEVTAKDAEAFGEDEDREN